MKNYYKDGHGLQILNQGMVTTCLCHLDLHHIDHTEYWIGFVDPQTNHTTLVSISVPHTEPSTPYHSVVSLSAITWQLIAYWGEFTKRSIRGSKLLHVL